MKNTLLRLTKLFAGLLLGLVGIGTYGLVLYAIFSEVYKEGGLIGLIVFAAIQVVVLAIAAIACSRMSRRKRVEPSPEPSETPCL